MGSLTEGINFDKPGAKGSSKGASKGGAAEGDSKQTMKLVVAIVCLLGAGVAVAYQLGVFDGAEKPVAVDPKKEAEYKEQVKKAEAQKKIEEKEWEKLPPSQRPVKVGSN